jgi:hypothetical protein
MLLYSHFFFSLDFFNFFKILLLFYTLLFCVIICIYIFLLLQPFHVDINASQKSEVTEDIVRSTVKKAAGTADHVIAKSSSSHSMGGSGEYRSSPSKSSLVCLFTFSFL